MPRRVALPADLQRASFSVAEARAHGIGEGRLRSPDLVAPFSGVRRHRLLAVTRAEDYAPRLRSGQFFSHTTAARIHGIPLPPSREAPLHVTAILPVRAPRVRGVIGHHARGTVATTTVGGLPVIDALDTWAQLASLLSVEELVAAGDALVRRVRPLATIDQLHELVARRSLRRRKRMLCAALDLIREGTDSPQESVLRLGIIAAGLPEPEINGVVYDDRGRMIGLVDMLYRRWRVAVEYEGAHHFLTEVQGHHDIDRYERLAQAGWRVIRVHKQHLASPHAPHLRSIRAAIAAAETQ